MCAENYNPLYHQQSWATCFHFYGLALKLTGRHLTVGVFAKDDVVCGDLMWRCWLSIVNSSVCVYWWHIKSDRSAGFKPLENLYAPSELLGGWSDGFTNPSSLTSHVPSVTSDSFSNFTKQFKIHIHSHWVEMRKEPGFSFFWCFTTTCSNIVYYVMQKYRDLYDCKCTQCSSFLNAITSPLLALHRVM